MPEIVIKIKDRYFLQNNPFFANQSRFRLGANFFTTISSVYSIYAGGINPTASITVFQGLLQQLNTAVFESLFYYIDANNCTDLMQKAKMRTGFVGQNLLNFYIVKIPPQNFARIAATINEMVNNPDSGVEFAYLRGEVAYMETMARTIDKKTIKAQHKNLDLISETKRPETLNKKALLTVHDKISQFFSNYHLDQIDVSNEVTVVDMEQGWANNVYIASLPSGIIGGGVGRPEASHKNHGRKTLTLLFGKKLPLQSPNNPHTRGLCYGATAKKSSIWFNKIGAPGTIEIREAALVKTYAQVNDGSIILLEFQIARWNLFSGLNPLLPCEIEYGMHAAIKAGIHAGYIVVEAAANAFDPSPGTVNLDTVHNALNTSLQSTVGNVNVLNDYPVNLSNALNSSGAVMVGAVNAAGSVMLNTGQRIDYYSFGEATNLTNTVSFRNTSLASGIITAFIAKMQVAAKATINRPLTISEIQLLLRAIRNNPTQTFTSFQQFLTQNQITTNPILP